MKCTEKEIIKYKSSFTPPFTFQDIKDPNVNKNIKDNIFNDNTNITLNLIEALADDKKEKLSLVADRIEFIQQLTAFCDVIKKNTETEYVCKKVDTKIVVIENYQCEIFEIDFSAANYDIEALSIYLYLTCIEILSCIEKKDVFTFLREKLSNGDNITSDRIEEYQQEYSKIYGIRKGFINSFINKISDENKNIWSNNFIVCTISKNNDNNSIAELNPQSKEEWEKKDITKKLKSIADQLYELRCKYTHTVTRSFLLTMPVKNSTIEFKNKTLIATSNLNLTELLKTTIIDLAHNFFDKK